MFVRGWQSLSAPLTSATPLPPFPINLASRALILGLYLAYGASGHFERDPWAVLGAAAVVICMAVAELGFLASFQDRESLLRTWAWVLPLDIVMLNIGAATDESEFSLFSIIAISTIHSASAMFGVRYVLSVAAFAAILDLTANIGPELLAGHVAVWPSLLSAVLILGMGAFAANRGRAEESLRRELVASEALQREQARSLRVALEAARISETRFQAFSDNAPAALLLMDRNGRVVFQSGSTASLLGAEMVDREVRLHGVGPEDTARVQAAIREAEAGRPATAQFRYTSPDGRVHRFNGIWFPVEGGAGAIITDVTRERTLAAQVVRAQQMETVGTLAGGIAHDFNNLLTAILGNLYLAATEIPLDSQAAQCLRDARLAGERGAELVQQLLRFARPGVEHLEPVSVTALIGETLALARRALMSNVTVTVSPPPNDAVVLGNFASLQQVLMNLLVNARDAMPGGGAIGIRYERVTIDAAAEALAPGPYHAIFVSDTGSGMDAATLDRIFDPFFTTKDVGQGSGLGLPTSLGILRAHGGWMDADSTPGAGSTFRILLPVHAPPASPDRDARAAPSLGAAETAVLAGP